MKGREDYETTNNEEISNPSQWDLNVGPLVYEAVEE